MIVNNDTNIIKLFEVDCLLNKQVVKKYKGCTVKYLIY